ncbi:MAG: cupin domain-containing protein [Pseudomonadota bacterium]
MKVDMVNGWAKTETPGIGIIVLNKHEDGRLKTALFRVEPGVSTDMHSHNVEEEVYVLEGDMREVGCIYLAGDYAIRKPNELHSISSLSGYTALVVYR